MHTHVTTHSQLHTTAHDYMHAPIHPLTNTNWCTYTRSHTRIHMLVLERKLTGILTYIYSCNSHIHARLLTHACLRVHETHTRTHTYARNHRRAGFWFWKPNHDFKIKIVIFNFDLKSFSLWWFWIETINILMSFILFRLKSSK